MRSTTLLVALAVAFALPAAASAHSVRSTRALVSGLRAGISWHRSMTWTYQDRAGLARTPTRYAERRTRSVAFLRWLDLRWSRRRVAARHRWHELVRRSSMAAVPSLICQVFGSAECGMAVAVARRESGFSVNAHNGQYLGIFQMGSRERATYATRGYSTAYEQIVAAYNYFRVSGWSPWSATAY